MLLINPFYKKNAIRPHLELHLKKHFEIKHFQQRLMRFKSTVNELFQDEIAHTVKSLAMSIATVMQIKISELNKQ